MIFLQAGGPDLLATVEGRTRQVQSRLFTDVGSLGHSGLLSPSERSMYIKLTEDNNSSAPTPTTLSLLSASVAKEWMRKPYACFFARAQA